MTNSDPFAAGPFDSSPLVLPQVSRIQEAQEAQPDIPLGTAEQFLLTLASVSGLEARLRLWAFKVGTILFKASKLVFLTVLIHFFLPLMNSHSIYKYRIKQT